jgi:hypothetical protein
MDGAAFLTYMQRRLAENGLSVDAERVAELLDYATEGRDLVLQALATAAPVAVKAVVQLELDPTAPGGSDRYYRFPLTTKDPYRVLDVVEANTDRPLSPSASLNQDGGEYVWVNTRQLRLSDDADPDGGINVTYVPSVSGNIAVGTAEKDIGLPVPCHRCAAKAGVVLALTADEQSDARAAIRLYEQEIDTLSTLYGDYDANGGLALREALLASIGTSSGDTLY